MVPKPDVRLRGALLDLAQGIRDGAVGGRESGALKPEKTLLWRPRVTDWRYTEKGLSVHATSDEVSKASWHRAEVTLAESTERRPEYGTALALLGEGMPSDQNPQQKLRRFVSVVARASLLRARQTESQRRALVDRFLLDLEGTCQRCSVKVDIEGLMVFSDPIKFTDQGMTVVLRRSEPDDLAKEVPVGWFPLQTALAPTAILEIRVKVRRFIELQATLDQLMAVLRLFGVGSVRFTSYVPVSQSITEFFPLGTAYYGPREQVLETGLIRQEEASRLPAFWRRLRSAMGPSFSDRIPKDAKPAGIAYQRYCDALFRNGLTERRVAGAVMGLESVLLRADERQDLSYRLRMRAAMLLGCLGCDRGRVADAIRRGYQVRSTFVHGGYMDEKMKAHVGDHEGGTAGFVRELLQCLRLSIVAAALAKGTKDDLIKQLDAALLGEGEASGLRKMLRPAMEVLL